jgi:hypothetical protein
MIIRRSLVKDSSFNAQADVVDVDLADRHSWI